jgi:hypothetical protein
LSAPPFYVYFICILGFFITQIGNIDITEPKPNQEAYGWAISEDIDVIKSKALISLSREYSNNRYSTYPFGLYKVIVLNQEEQDRVGEILETAQKTDIAYDDFMNLMKEVDQILGGSSIYRPEKVKASARVEMTYEDAVEKYQELIDKDRLSGAYARIFCDYMGIMAGILPVFLSAALWLSDRRAGIQDIIYAKSLSTTKFILARFLALTIFALLPILILGLYFSGRFLLLDLKTDIAIDHLAFFKYIFGWILPTLSACLSLGMLLTILSNTPIAILVQFIWWYIDLSMGSRTIRGGYKHLLMPRHNELGAYSVFQEHLPTLTANRVLYVLLSFALVLLSLFILYHKRKGRFQIHEAVSGNRKSKF